MYAVKNLSPNIHLSLSDIVALGEEYNVVILRGDDCNLFLAKCRSRTKLVDFIRACKFLNIALVSGIGGEPYKGWFEIRFYYNV